ncbi:MAG: hypothetical protein OXF11_06655 [Deltaproteobacteria bacterium]|nr:hypothetical protein [Deltaproteobacteria bacterium]
MKTTIELPDAVFRQAKIVAAARGITLKRFFTEALVEQLRNQTKDVRTGGTDPPWMAGFGELADLSSETRRVLSVIEEAFERLSSEDLS